jgi:outer membrane protein assembly factor BamB
MERRDEQFTPEAVDEQVDSLSRDQYRPMTPGARLVHDLYGVYDDERTLARVWERLRNQAEGARARSAASEHIAPELQRSQRGRNRFMKETGISHGRTGMQRVSMVAAVLFAALLVGSMLWALTMARSYNASPAASSAPAKKAQEQDVQNRNASPLGVYVGTADGVSRLDVKTGKAIWNYEIKPDPNAPPAFTNAAVSAPPVVSGNVVYAASQNGKLYAIDAKSGSLRWVHDFQMEINEPFIADGLLYITANFNDSYIYALNLDNGSVHARYHIASPNPLESFATAAVANGVLYTTTMNTIQALRLSDSKQIWHTAIDAAQDFGTPQLVDGVLYVASSHVSEKTANEPQDSYAYAFNVQTGAKIWQSIDMTGFVLSSPTIADGVVYCGSQNGYAYAFNAHNGKLLWQRNPGGPTYPAPQEEDGVVFAGYATASGGGVTSGGIVAWNADGSLRWRKLIAGYMGDDPLVVHNGVVYANPMSGKLYALNAKDGSTLWTFQTPGFSPQPMIVTVVS